MAKRAPRRRGAQRAEEALRESDGLFLPLIESAPDGILIVDKHGRIVLVNSQTEKLFGYSRDELLGRPVEILMPERFRKAHVGHRATYYSAPRTRPMGAGLELTGRRKDGSEFATEISLGALRTEDGVLVTSTVT